MDCEIEDVTVYSADSDISPYDSGSYASSTTYVTGKAVEKSCLELREHLCNIASDMLEADSDSLIYSFDGIMTEDGSMKVSLLDIATKSMCGNSETVQVTASHSAPVSPPPYMAGMVEIEIDRETGEIKVLDYVGVIDCGTVINENLARIQAEGGILQGIGMALYEDINYTDKGKIIENSFMNYKIPARTDVGRIRVDFESSYEETGPFGAKSIGELVIDTPVPAIAHAIYNATGVMLKEVPFTPARILEAFDEN